jgi:hypothetical protein
MCYKIDNGKTVRFWKDNWEGLMLHSSFPKVPICSGQTKLSTPELHIRRMDYSITVPILSGSNATTLIAARGIVTNKFG